MTQNHVSVRHRVAAALATGAALIQKADGYRYCDPTRWSPEPTTFVVGGDHFTVDNGKQTCRGTRQVEDCTGTGEDRRCTPRTEHYTEHYSGHGGRVVEKIGKACAEFISNTLAGSQRSIHDSLLAEGDRTRLYGNVTTEASAGRTCIVDAFHDAVKEGQKARWITALIIVGAFAGAAALVGAAYCFVRRGGCDAVGGAIDGAGRAAGRGLARVGAPFRRGARSVEGPVRGQDETTASASIPRASAPERDLELAFAGALPSADARRQVGTQQTLPY